MQNLNMKITQLKRLKMEVMVTDEKNLTKMKWILMIIPALMILGIIKLP